MADLLSADVSDSQSDRSVSSSGCSSYGDEADQQHQPFVQQCLEAKELYLESSVPRIQPPSALEFYRDYVARNRPVIIQNAIDDWPALRKWPLKSYLRTKLSSATVTIDRVPLDERTGLGLGDSVVRGEYFVTPSEEQMKFGEFLDVLEGKRHTDGVLYCQHQNSSLTSEFTQLVADVSELDFASEAFGSEPDAINLWIGGDRSVSTLHHDPYENMYAVVTGAKHFLLYPPTDFYFLDKREYPKARWHYQPPAATESTAAAASSSSSSSSNAAAPAASAPSSSPRGTFSLIPDPDGAHTAWFDLEPQNCDGGTQATGVDVDSLPPLALCPSSTVPLPPPGPTPPYSTHPPLDPALRRRYTSPVWVELQAGEVLYLPALWFHRVAQQGDEQGKTIAVNFWYDMDYGSRYNAYRFQEAVAKEKRDTLAQMYADSDTDESALLSDEEEEDEEEEEEETEAGGPSCASSSSTTAATSAVAPSQPPILLVALCGLPAAGKTLLAQDVMRDRPEEWAKNGLPEGVEMHHVSFDAVYSGVRSHLRSRYEQCAGYERALFDPQVWKLSRVVAMQWAEDIIRRVRAEAVAAGSTRPHVLLLDDNFHLRSMRRRVYQLARNHSAAFMQLHVSCDVEQAVRRNAGRNRVMRARNHVAPHVEAMASSSPEDSAALAAIIAQLPFPDVPADAAQQAMDKEDAVEEDHAVSERTIRTMAAAFQAPPAVAHSPDSSAPSSSPRSCFPASLPPNEQAWERMSIRVGSERFEHLDLVERALAEALRSPLSALADPVVEAQRVAEARAHSEADLAHQLDLATRRVLNAHLASCDGERKAERAAHWNALRRQLLLDARKPDSAAHHLCQAALRADADANSSASSSSSASTSSSASAVEMLAAHFQQLLTE